MYNNSLCVGGFGGKVMKTKPKGVHEVFYQMKKADKGVYGGGDLLRPRDNKGRASSSSVLKTSPLVLWTSAIGLLFLFCVHMN